MKRIVALSIIICASLVGSLANAAVQDDVNRLVIRFVQLKTDFAKAQADKTLEAIDSARRRIDDFFQKAEEFKVKYSVGTLNKLLLNNKVEYDQLIASARNVHSEAAKLVEEILQKEVNIPNVSTHDLSGSL